MLAEGFTHEEIAGGLKIYDAVGCPDCTEGYKGRTGIYQVMPMTDEIQAIVLAGGNAMQIAEAAQARRRPRPAPVGPAQGQERRHQPRRNQPRHQGLSHVRDPYRCPYQAAATARRPDAMPLFIWEGTDKRGIKMKGEQPAKNANLVRADLRRQGITPQVVKAKPKPLFGGAGKRDHARATSRSSAASSPR